MGHPRWPGFDTKTGNPVLDNENRNLNRRIWKDTQQRLTFKAKNRKAKKRITRIEGGTYIKIVVAVTNQMIVDARNAR